MLADRKLSTPRRNQFKEFDKKVKEYDDEFEKNMQSIELAQKRIENKMHDRQFHPPHNLNYDQNEFVDPRWDMSAGLIGKKASDDRLFSQPQSLVQNINNQLLLQGKNTFKGPNVQLPLKNVTS